MVLIIPASKMQRIVLFVLRTRCSEMQGFVLFVLVAVSAGLVIVEPFVFLAAVLASHFDADVEDGAADFLPHESAL